MGGADLREMREGRMDPAGLPMTQAGYILGIVHFLVACLTVAVVVLFFVLLA